MKFALLLVAFSTLSVMARCPPRPPQFVRPACDGSSLAESTFLSMWWNPGALSRRAG